jgi:hypothetical protein
LASGARLDDGGRGPQSTVFVADLSSEAEALAAALRTAGHIVVDVPPSMLVARVAVQRPRVVVVDADGEGALEVVERMRELPEADDIHVLFIANPGGAIASAEEALAHEGSGLFVRPVDVTALVQKVHALTGRTRVEGSHAVWTRKASSAPPSLPPASMRASIPPAEMKSSAPPSPRSTKSPSDPPAASGGSAARRVMSLAPPVSPELRELLAEAEERIHVQIEHESVVPSPEDEIEAVLPADLLAALDEPLDEDEDDDDPVVPQRFGATSLVARERTSVRTATARPGRAGAKGTTASGTGPAPSAGARQSDAPGTLSPPHTHAGTQAGPSGDGTSTTGGGSDARDRSDMAGRSTEGSVPPPSASAWQASVAGTPDRDRESSPPRPTDPPMPAVLGPGDAMRAIAQAIAARTTGSLCVATHRDGPAAPPSPARGPELVERRIVLREGDVVTTSSTAEDESLLAFLGVRGDLPRETVRRLASKFPPHGRHAGAALVARGYVRQDQMWPTLRAHAEWIFARAAQTPHGRFAVEAQPPGRLGGEPSVFGGSTGAAVFVEVVRRIVPPTEAIERLGGIGSRLGAGSETRLLDECALGEAEVEQVQGAAGRTLRDALEVAPDTDLATVIFALAQLGVMGVLRSLGEGAAREDDQSEPDVAALDAEAVRERVRARMQLIEDGDYFALLGVPRDATGYEVRRAFLELRRSFDPSRVAAADVLDLVEDVRKIGLVLEEAYEILKDGARRERYRRAIEAVPSR